GHPLPDDEVLVAAPTGAAVPPAVPGHPLPDDEVLVAVANAVDASSRSANKDIGLAIQAGITTHDPFEATYGSAGTAGLSFSDIMTSWRREREALIARIDASLWHTSNATDVENEYRNQVQGQRQFVRPSRTKHAPGSADPTGTLHPSRETSLSIGVVVHHVLEQLDLRTIMAAKVGTGDVRGDSRSVDEEIRALARRSARSHHIEEYADDIARMVMNALESDTVREAARCRYAQEVPVAAPLESFLRAIDMSGTLEPAGADSSSATAGATAVDSAGAAVRERLLASDGSIAVGAMGVEGVIDLLIEGNDGLVVADFKSEARELENEYDRCVRNAGASPLAYQWSPSRSQAQATPPVFAEYVLQLAFYAGVIEAVTQKMVSRCIIIYLGGTTPTEHVIEGVQLREAMERAGKIARRLALSIRTRPPQ
ncbi:MAG: PD-(D/E)XK nuclease family protein, partial [Acidimicrobiales bacterium]